MVALLLVARPNAIEGGWGTRKVDIRLVWKKKKKPIDSAKGWIRALTLNRWRDLIMSFLVKRTDRCKEVEWIFGIET